MTLATKLADMKAQDNAWLAANPGGFVCSLTEDLEHWKGYGITTAEGLDSYLAAEDAKEARKAEWD